MNGELPPPTARAILGELVAERDAFLAALGYPATEMTGNPAYRLFLT